ncbi:Uncharacterized protein FKW44_008526, partial [Caligus rogercresseyi]
LLRNRTIRSSHAAPGSSQQAAENYDFGSYGPEVLHGSGYSRFYGEEEERRAVAALSGNYFMDSQAAAGFSPYSVATNWAGYSPAPANIRPEQPSPHRDSRECVYCGTISTSSWTSDATGHDLCDKCARHVYYMRLKETSTVAASASSSPPAVSPPKVQSSPSSRARY